ncbi:MAG: hypothetical protein J4O01_11700, partial [Chloroflexi bacterium]|nr:hypothetical protein [Chloroflexota bacterium]
ELDLRKLVRHLDVERRVSFLTSTSPKRSLLIRVRVEALRCFDFDQFPVTGFVCLNVRNSVVLTDRVRRFETWNISGNVPALSTQLVCSRTNLLVVLGFPFGCHLLASFCSLCVSFMSHLGQGKRSLSRLGADMFSRETRIRQLNKAALCADRFGF